MSEQPAQNGSVFLSYSRKDKEFVRKLHEGLVANNVKVWVDWEGIPLSADWMAEITSAVEGSDTFVVVISPDWLASKVCADELELGLKNNKKLVPILYRDPLKGTSMHEKLAATNWVYMREQDDFDATLPKLVDAIVTDLDWVKAHTRLLQRANEWNNKNKNSSYLLRGSDLQDGEKWMNESTTDINRMVLPLQADYISASRLESVRRQRMTLIGVSLAFVVSIFLAVFALFQRTEAVASQHLAQTKEVDAKLSAETAVANERIAATQKAIAITAQAEAEENAILAKAERNAAEAQLYQSKADGLDVSTLLAIDSWNTSPSIQAEEILRQNLSIMPKPLAKLSQAGAINAITFNPDGSAFATASQGGKACVWNAETFAEMFCVSHTENVTDALFILDGEQLVTSSLDGVVGFWNSSNGNPIRSIDMGVPATGMDTSPDGQWLAIGRSDDSFLAIDYKDPRLKEYLVAVTSSVSALKFSPDSRWMGVGTKSGRLHFWYTGSRFTTSSIGHDGEVFALAFSPDSEYMVSVGEDSRARVSKTTSGREVWSLLHGDWTEDVSFNPDGTWFTVGADDSRVWLWNINTGLSKPRLHHADMVQKVLYSPDGQWIASTGYDQTLRIWDQTAGAEMNRAVLNGIGVALAFSPDGKHIVAGTKNGEVSVWEIAMLMARQSFVAYPEVIQEPVFSPSGDSLYINTDEKKVWKLSTANLLNSKDGTTAEMVISGNSLTNSQAISPDGTWLATVQDENNSFTLFNTTTQDLRTLTAADAISDIAFSADSQSVVSGGADGKIIIWDTQSGEQKFSLDAEAPVVGIAISPDGTKLVSGLEGRASTIVWDMSTRQKLVDLPQVGNVGETLFSKDGKWLATGDNLGIVILWDAQNLSMAQPVYILNHTDRVLSMAFSPDMRWLVVGSEDKFAHIWDVAAGHEVFRIPHVNAVDSVTFTPDGKYLLTSALKTMLIWEPADFSLTPLPDLIPTACSRMTENMTQTQWDTVYGKENYRIICPDLPQGQE